MAKTEDRQNVVRQTDQEGRRWSRRGSGRGSVKLVDGVERRQAVGIEKVVDGVSQGGARQSRLAWKGDERGSEEANGVVMCSHVKGIT